MGQLSVTLNGRTYRLRCGDGQEEQVQELSKFFSDRIDSIRESVGQVGDDRLYVMAALTIVDELFEARKQIGALTAGDQDPDENMQDPHSVSRKFADPNEEGTEAVQKVSAGDDKSPEPPIRDGQTLE